MAQAEIIKVIAAVLCFILAGLVKGWLDRSSENRFKNPWWNKGQSWRNKWKDPENKIEKFWGSSTYFAWTTDGWHLLQMIMYRLTDAGIFLILVSDFSPSKPMVYVFCIVVFRGILFRITHKK